MYTKRELESDLEILKINTSEELTIKYVTLHYKRVAKEKHPDKGGTNEAFKELIGAYEAVGKLNDEKQPEESDDKEEKEARRRFKEEI